jgi:hypothetical protein
MQPLFISKTFFIRIDDERLIDADLAEFVFDDGYAFSVVLGEDAVQERGLARAEKACEHRDGDLIHEASFNAQASELWRSAVVGVSTILTPWLCAAIALCTSVSVMRRALFAMIR